MTLQTIVPADPDTPANTREDGPASRSVSSTAARTEGTLRFAAAARITVMIAAAVGLLYFARAVILPIVVAGVLSMALTPPMRWLARLNLPLPLAAIVVLLVLVVPSVWAVTQFARPAVAWFEEAPANVVRLKQRLTHVLRPAQRLSQAAAQVGSLDDATPATNPAQRVEVTDHRLTSTVFTWTGAALVGVGETLALLFLLLASGDSFLQKAARVLPNFTDPHRAAGLVREIQQGISTYLFSIGVINLCFGIVMIGAFALTGMPQPVMWGLLAALLNFIPYFGPVVGIAVLGLAGLLSFDTVGAGLLPAAVYLTLHLIEANFVTPILVGHRVTLNSVLVLASLMFFVWLWGMPGAFVAVPLLVSARVICERIPSLQPLAEFLSR